MNFTEHKEATAADCEAIAKIFADAAENVRSGDMKAFEQLLIEGGTEEGDCKLAALREIAIMRYAHREEQVYGQEVHS